MLRAVLAVLVLSPDLDRRVGRAEAPVPRRGDPADGPAVRRHRGRRPLEHRLRRRPRPLLRHLRRRRASSTRPATTPSRSTSPTGTSTRATSSSTDVTTLLDARGAALRGRVLRPRGPRAHQGRPARDHLRGHRHAADPAVGAPLRARRAPARPTCRCRSPSSRTRSRRRAACARTSASRAGRPSARTIYTGSEGALVQDGPAAGIGVPSPARLLRYNLKTGRPDRQYLYVDRPDRRAAGACDELRRQRPRRAPAARQALVPRDGALVLGRRARHRQHDQALHGRDLGGARNVNGRRSLAGQLGSIEPARKTLLLNLDDARHPAGQRRGHDLRPRPRRRAAHARPRQRQQLRARAVHAVPALRLLGAIENRNRRACVDSRQRRPGQRCSRRAGRARPAVKGGRRELRLPPFLLASPHGRLDGPRRPDRLGGPRGRDRARAGRVARGRAGRAPRHRRSRRPRRAHPRRGAGSRDRHRRLARRPEHDCDDAFRDPLHAARAASGPRPRRLLLARPRGDGGRAGCHGSRGDRECRRPRRRLRRQDVADRRGRGHAALSRVRPRPRGLGAGGRGRPGHASRGRRPRRARP